MTTNSIAFPLIAPVDEENNIYQGYIPINVNKDIYIYI